MTNTYTQKIKHFLKRFYVLWIILYVLIISGTVVFGATAYHKYTEHQLPTGHIELKVSKTSYQIGESIEFSIINHFPTTIYVTNGCPKEPLNVYIWENEKWIELHDIAEGEDSECYREPRNIPILPEGSRTYNFDDWPDLFRKPGVYRIATSIDHYSDVPFQDFVILEPAKIVEVKREPTSATPPTPPTPVPAEVAPKAVPPTETYEDRDDDREDRYEREEEDD